MMEEAGADLITVHGRFREQYYSGKSDREIIRKIKKALSIPVIGNGDIFTGADALEMFETTGCDGIMVARGALGNPWIFSEIRAALENTPYTPPTLEERIRILIRHYENTLAYDGERKAVREMRKHVGWYLKGMPRSTDLKNRINTETDSRKVLESLAEYGFWLAGQ